MSNYIITDGELYHWGIKGMKWGVRRYQNKDGSLTEAGKKRQERREARAASADYKRAREKSTKQMTDAELRASINRLQMEQQYKNLTASQKSTGRQLAEGILKDSTKQVAVSFITKFATSGINKLIGMVPDKEKAAKAKEAADLVSKVQGMSDADLSSAFKRKNMEEAYLKLLKK